MSEFSVRPETTQDAVVAALGDKVHRIHVALGEVTVQVAQADYLQAMLTLRDAPGCRFDQLIDLCGMDYSAYRDGLWEGARFCVVSHLLSMELNQRLRVKVFCTDDELPVVDSVNGLWAAANWFEREIGRAHV